MNSKISKYLNSNICKTVIDKLSSSNLLNNNVHNSLFNIKIKEITLTLKITFDCIDREKEIVDIIKNNQVIGLPHVYKSIMYEDKLLTFYEHYEHNLMNFFKEKYTEKELKNIIEQIKIIDNNFHKLTKMYTTNNIKDFLYKYENDEIKICLFNFNIIETQFNIETIVDEFFINLLIKSNTDTNKMFKFCYDNSGKSFIEYMEKHIIQLRIEKQDDVLDNIYNKKIKDVKKPIIKWMIKHKLLHKYLKMIKFQYHYITK